MAGLRPFKKHAILSGAGFAYNSAYTLLLSLSPRPSSPPFDGYRSVEETMPSFCITLNRYFSSCAHRLALMPRKAVDEATEQTPRNQTENATQDTRASMLVFISAKAIGSFGFAIVRASLLGVFLSLNN